MAIENQFYNLQAEYVTMKYDSSIVYDVTKQHGATQVGMAVMMTGQGTVGLVTTGSEVYGQLVKVDNDGYCTIQDEGYCSLPFSGAPAYTQDLNGLVGGATAGQVKPATVVPAAGSVRRALAIKVDPDDNTRIIVKLT